MFNFEIFKEIQIFGFPCCSIHEDLSIDVSITNVGLILTKLRWLQLFGTRQNTSQKLILNFFENKLDVDPQRDDDASPMSTYRCMFRPTWMLI